jgi:hypothetical protein
MGVALIGIVVAAVYVILLYHFIDLMSSSVAFMEVNAVDSGVERTSFRHSSIFAAGLLLLHTPKRFLGNQNTRMYVFHSRIMLKTLVALGWASHAL